jgi:hypothetical protein
VYRHALAAAKATKCVFTAPKRDEFPFITE